MARKLDIDNWKSIPEETLLTVKEAAGILRMSETKVRAALNNEKLDYYRPSTDGDCDGDYRIMMADLLTYLEEHKGKPKSARREETSRRAKGKPFKHIEPTWLHEPSRQQDGKCRSRGGRNGRSSAGSNGRGGRR